MSERASSVTVFAGSATEAAMVRSYLESNGITVNLDNEHIGMMAPYIAAAGGAGAVKVTVASDDAARAKELLAERRGHLRENNPTDAASYLCPRCGSLMEAGFASKSSPLSHVAPQKFEAFAFIDEDLAKAGLRVLLPWKAEYLRSYLCRPCELYLIDYGTSLSRAQAAEIAQSLIAKK
jgi:hypothetical protein